MQHIDEGDDVVVADAYSTSERIKLDAGAEEGERRRSGTLAIIALLINAVPGT